MRTDYATIVLGLGGLGAATAYWLARRAGKDVLGLEQFEFGHPRGSSQDHSRIIRLSYHTPGYVALARQAYQAWAAVEDEAGEALYFKTGSLNLAPHGGTVEMQDYCTSLQAHAIPLEQLDAQAVMRRWPAFCLPADVQGLYQEAGGVLPAGRCNAAHLRLARTHGATLREHAPVSALRPLNGEVEVVAGEVAYRCSRLIIAAGPWSNQILAHLGLHLPLTVTQEQVTYFASPRLVDFEPQHFPVWIWMDDPCFYGCPAHGEAGPKVGQDVGGREVTPETRTFAPDSAALARVRDFVARHLPTALGPEICTRTCLYTLTPDRDFVIDRVPGHSNIFLTIGAGHAFKFAALIGKILAALALDGTSSAELGPFRSDREILTLADPPRRFRV